MILVDEFQDVDRCQLDILKMLSEDHRNLFVVGDDDQAIYGFRGATPDVFIDFEKTFKGARTIVLDRNFRSSDELVRRGGAMIANNLERVVKLVRGLDQAADVSFARPGTSKQEASDVVTRVKTLNADGVPLGEIAIMYRTNELSLPFEMALEKEKIPFSVRHGGTFFDLKEINPLVRYLEIASRRHTWASLEAIANWPNRYLPRDVVQAWKCNASRDVLECLEASLTGDPLKDKGIRRLHDDLTYLIANADGKTTLGLLDLIVEHVNYLSTASSIHGFRGPDDPGLKELLGQLEDACEAEPDPREFLARVRRSREFARRRRKRDDAVQLVTFHSVKGLEFEAVFLTGMSEGVMPHKKSIADDNIEEERRLAYVGWTRSKRAVHVSSPVHIGDVSRFAVEWGVTNPLSGRATSSTLAEQPSAPSTSDTGSPELT
jgi:DNA helicase-2/ATP-dependent DNA helicase PcrA